jgi:hypothetical protein
MAAFAISFLALLAGLSGGFVTAEYARETVRATQILAEKLDTIRLYSWDQVTAPGYITNTFYTRFYPTNGLAGGDGWSDPGFAYTGTVTIANAPFAEPYASNDLKMVTVSLTWPSGRRIRQAQMSSLVARYGVQSFIY